LLHFPHPQNFPKDYVLGGNLGEGNLLPVILTYPILSKVMSLAFRIVSTGQWSPGQGRTYLTSNCINTKYASVALSRAMTILNLENARLDSINALKDSDSDKLHRRFLLDRERFPEKYEPMDYPAMYT
jgi:hypothetical protein